MKPRTLALAIRYPSPSIAIKALLLAIAFLFIGIVSSASAKGVTTRMEKEANIEPGSYSVVAYGCTGANDPRSVAILQRTDSPYHVSIVEPRAEVQTVPGLTADEAYRRAESFVTCNPNANQTQLSRITAPDGTLIGYELTPVYIPLRAGSADGIDTSYRIKGNNVLAYVTVDPLLKQNQMGGG